MVALTKDRDTARRDGKQFNDPMAAAKQIFAGSIVVLDGSGDAAPATTATGLVVRGVAEENIDNSSGAAGDLAVSTRAGGVFRFANDGTVARVDIGGTAYIVDDQTVADNDGTGTRSALGEIKDVDSDGVWVQVG